MTDLSGPDRSSPDQFGADRPLAGPDLLGSRPVALVDLLDRVLATGVVVSGELVLSIAEVDLVYISLRALLASVRAAAGPGPVGVGAP